MNGTKVSVIIPAYNESQTIEQVIKTIKTDHPDFEIIVVDDGSPVDLVSAHLRFNPVVPKEFYTHKPELVHTIGTGPVSERIFIQPRSFVRGLRISFFSLCIVMIGFWVWRPKRHVPNT
jgi:cellulose synthase/poly-beta-1,6-N-acetylglucosamine synthase-like glycosyltransferase